MRYREQAERDYQARLDDFDIQQKQRERYFQIYCQDRADGLSHEEAADECRSLADEFKAEWEKQMAEYHKAIGRAA